MERCTREVEEVVREREVGVGEGDSRKRFGRVVLVCALFSCEKERDVQQKLRTGHAIRGKKRLLT